MRSDTWLSTSLALSSLGHQQARTFEMLAARGVKLVSGCGRVLHRPVKWDNAVSRIASLCLFLWTRLCDFRYLMQSNMLLPFKLVARRMPGCEA